MRRISGIKVGLLAFVATGTVIVAPGLVPPAAAAPVTVSAPAAMTSTMSSAASAALTAPAPLVTAPPAG